MYARTEDTVSQTLLAEQDLTNREVNSANLRLAMVNCEVDVLRCGAHHMIVQVKYLRTLGAVRTNAKILSI